MTDNNASGKILVYGAMWCPDCRRAKQFFGEHRIDYDWIDITDNDEAIAEVERMNNGGRSIPTILFPDGDVLIEPSNGQLAEKMGVKLATGKQYYDVIVIGGGPAGLTAAIYTAREGLSTVVIESGSLGGQVAITQDLDNFPGFPTGVTGEEFAARMIEQAARFEVDTLPGERVVDVARDGQYLTVKANSGRELIGRSVLVTTGSKYRRLGIPNERELIGKSVHFCATCDGAFYKGKDVLVIGGGNSGFEEGLFLANKFANSVKIVEFLPEAKASQILQDKVATQENMSVVLNHAVQAFKMKDGQMSAVVVEDRATGEISEWQPDGVFVFIGLEPNSGFLPESIERNQWGFIKTDATLMTSLEGVFAAGDVREGSTKQAVSAAGEGATAAMMIREYLKRVDDLSPINEIERDHLVAGAVE